ncbi:MAG: UvrD-helicase domain-containing protein [Alphaproteobacteria bacterium]|nr:UvrD-helicase domain-containing protein [Alphaproteobacteria bacterium]
MMMNAPVHSNFSYLERLNPAQRAAVEALDGPVLVLAGAGTGKTRVLTTRLGHLLATRRAQPWEILAVTFTNKAAAEMKRRVAEMLEQPVEGWWLGTFHSLAARMLRQHAEIAGLKPNFTILDEDDQIRLLKQLMETENIDVKKWPPRLLLGVIQKWNDKGLTPDQVTADDAGHIADGRLLPLYRAYQGRLKILNACDFGDLLLHVLTIFRDPAHADVLARYQERFKYVMVDEYQDTNTGQYLWLRLLAQKHKNICCVGDDDQSIYGWRGADIGNILKFEKDFPGAKIVRLEQNYRSTQHILSAANGVIAHNKGRLGKELWSAGDPGDKVTIRGVWDGMQEAAAAAEMIEDLQRRGVPLREIAVLVRAAHQTRAFEERFIKEVIPHKVLAGMRFYERQEIRDAIAYLRLIAQPDDDMAFERVINMPKRGIGGATVAKIHVLARSRQTSLHNALGMMLETDELTGKTKERLKSFMENLARWRVLLREMSHVELAQIVLDESGYTAMWLADKSPEAAGRLENLKEFVNALNEFDSLDMFLEHVSLVMDADGETTDDQVSIMTYHAAKGLEFDAVILPGWEEGLFPNQRAMDENGLAGLEEERRLAYVGITRARKRAAIFFAANRLIYGSWASSLPSRFIDELPKDHVEVATETGLYQAQPRRQDFSPRNRPAHLAEIAGPAPSMESERGFGPGDKVFHEKFGQGTVVTADGDKLDIKFDHAGRKKVLDSFIRKA